MNQLNRVRDTGLAVLVAPVGSGKTTLITQWLAGQGGRALWYDAARLPSPSEMRADLGHGKRPAAVVVVAGRHSGASGRPAFERFLEHAVARAPVVVCARRLPLLNYARGELPLPTVITAADLAFRPWEVEALFAEVLEDPLPGDGVLELTERTEGWAAALHLWHVARRVFPSEDDRRSEALPSASRVPECLRAYLVDEVLDEVSPATLAFLRDSSVFDVVTARLADELLGATDSHRRLAEAADTVELVSRMPDGSRYRYHRVLREHLRLLLADEQGPAGTLAVHARAAEVLAGQRDWDAALGASCRAGRWEAAGELVRCHGAQLAVTGADAADLLPEPALEGRPWLAWERARGLLGEGRVEQAGSLAVLARDRMGTPTDRAACQQMVDQARALRGGGANAPTDPWPAVLAFSSAARTACPQGRPTAEDRGRRVFTSLAEGRLRDADWMLTDVSAQIPSNDPLLLAARVAVTAAHSLLDPASSATALEDACARLPSRSPLWLRRLGYAAVLAQHGDARRIRVLRDLAVQRRQVGDEWGAALVTLAVAAALARRGEPDAEDLEQLRAQLRRLRADSLAAWAVAALSARPTDDPAGVNSKRSPAEPARVPSARTVTRNAVASALAGGAPGADDVLPIAARSRAPRSEQTPSVRAAAARTSDADAVRWRSGADARQAAATTPPWGGLQVRCFGGFEVRVGAARLDVSGLRPMAGTVLRVLAVNAGVPVHREVLVELLWPALRESAALHNLHVAVSSLRSRFEDVLPGQGREVLARQGQAYVFAPGLAPVTDVQRLDALLSTARRCRQAGDRLSQVAALGDAVESYTAEVLPADGPAEWVVGIRERCRLRVAEAAGSLALLELERGHLPAAAEAAQRSVQLDPWQDTAWRLLIEAHRRAGDHVKASKVNQDYRALLTSIGVSPVPLPEPHQPRGRSGGGARTDREPWRESPAGRVVAVAGHDRRK